MEACSGAHHFARRFQQMGHTVKLMAPQYVKPFVQRHKTDARDAMAICEAAQRESIPSVAVKTVDQQAVLALHRVRQSLMKARVAQINQIRGLLTEFGVVIPAGAHKLQAQLPGILEDGDNALPDLLRTLVQDLRDHLRVLDGKIAHIEQRLKDWHRNNEASRRLEALPGVGLITATALVAEVGDAKHFARGRQFAAWIGLTPREHSSGGQSIKLGISKRGNRYLRTLLIHGARAVLNARANKPEHAQDWLMRVNQRRGHNKAAVAQANKTARRVWALLSTGEAYNPEHTRAAA
jgi:transposase